MQTLQCASRTIAEVGSEATSLNIIHKICVTSRARLGFHAAWNYGANGRTFTDPEATLMLYSTYPMPVRRWIASRGGLTPHTIFLSGKSLQEMYRSCSEA
jgi:hypothetical protein